MCRSVSRKVEVGGGRDSRGVAPEHFPRPRLSSSCGCKKNEAPVLRYFFITPKSEINKKIQHTLFCTTYSGNGH